MNSRVCTLLRCHAFELLPKLVQEVTVVPLAILIVLVVALFLLFRTDEVNKGVLLGIRIEDSPGLEVIDGGHPLVAFFARVATEKEVTLGFFFLVTVVPHRDRDIKLGLSLRTCLERTTS